MIAPLDDDALTRALAALSDWLTAAGVPYAVIGGIAVSLRASPRYTQDIDAVVWVDDAGWAALLAAAAEFGIRPRIDDALGFSARSRVLLLSHDNGVPLDVSCDALPFEHDLVQAAAVLDVGGVMVRVARPEHLLVLKAVADRPRDHADIESLRRAHRDRRLCRQRGHNPQGGEHRLRITSAGPAAHTASAIIRPSRQGYPSRPRWIETRPLEPDPPAPFGLRRA